MITGFTTYNLDLNTLRVISLVRDMTLKDYHDKRAWLHDRWLKDSELLWKTNKIVLSYPDMPNYPTEAEIVSAAKEIIEMMKNPITDDQIKAASDALASRPSGPSFPMEPVQPPVPTPEPVPVPPPEPEPTPEPTPEPIPEPVKEEPPVTSKPTEKVEAEAVVDAERAIHNEIPWILERLYDTRTNKNKSK